MFYVVRLLKPLRSKSVNGYRKLCYQEAPKVQKFVETSPEVPKDFIAAKGNVELTMDAAKVNTLQGWRDMKIGIFGKRLLGEGVGISYWVIVSDWQRGVRLGVGKWRVLARA